jgi:FXSXX-COOH protein
MAACAGRTSLDKEPQDYDSDFVEVGALPLRDLLALDESVLGHALRRLQHEADHPEEILAGWSSNL